MLLLSVALIAIGLFGDHCSAAPFEDEHEKWQPAKSCSEIYTQSELNFDEVSDVVTQRKTKYRNINNMYPRQLNDFFSQITGVWVVSQLFSHQNYVFSDDNLKDLLIQVDISKPERPVISCSKRSQKLSLKESH